MDTITPDMPGQTLGILLNVLASEHSEESSFRVMPQRLGSVP